VNPPETIGAGAELSGATRLTMQATTKVCAHVAFAEEASSAMHHKDKAAAILRLGLIFTEMSCSRESQALCARFGTEYAQIWSGEYDLGE
jgi:hypothetical protein